MYSYLKLFVSPSVCLRPILFTLFKWTNSRRIWTKYDMAASFMQCYFNPLFLLLARLLCSSQQIILVSVIVLSSCTLSSPQQSKRKCEINSNLFANSSTIITRKIAHSLTHRRNFSTASKQHVLIGLESCRLGYKMSCPQKYINRHSMEVHSIA